MILRQKFVPFVRRFVALAWAVNGVGFLLLANVVRVAVLSSRVAFGWPVTPRLALIYHVPYVLILPVCVGGALIGHIALTRCERLAQSEGVSGALQFCNVGAAWQGECQPLNKP